MTARRGFGIAAAVPDELIAPLASAAEEAGYSTFWVNDTPGADGIAALRAAAAVTSVVRLGVGVLPLDRRTPPQIVSSVIDAGLPSDRLVIGVGAGGAHRGSLKLVEAGVAELKYATEAQIAVGALGMRMIELAALRADGVILNWLTPDWAATSVEGIRDAPRSDLVEVIGYVRTALEVSMPALQAEAARYESFPAYVRHFGRMGVRAIDTCVYGDATAIAVGLRAFDQSLDETVARAIVAKESLESYRAILDAGAPN